MAVILHWISVVCCVSGILPIPIACSSEFEQYRSESAEVVKDKKDVRMR